MNTFFTSDWHIFHENSLKFDNRPFRNINHMHEVLVNNYNACVKDADVCYFLGDMGMAGTENLKTVVSRLNGQKVFIMGNHDKGVNAMYNAGFDVVLYNATLYIANQRVSLSHCPLVGVWREDVKDMRGAVDGENWHGESKNHRFSVKDEDQFHLHGHTHKSSDEDVVAGKQWDIGVVGNKYRPVSSSQIESWIVKYLRGIK